MSTIYELRPAQATLSDARALLTVEQSSLADSPYTPEEVLEVLQRPEHRAYLALNGDETVGFCSYVETLSVRGIRGEIDMLGVLSTHRCRGLGTRLIRLSMERAAERGVRLFRGIVARDNLASQRAFQHAGLEAPPQPAELMLYELRGNHPVPFLGAGWQWQMEQREQGGCPVLSHEIHRLTDSEGDLGARALFLPVHTLAYHGLWVEEVWASTESARSMIARAAVERAKVLELDQVGHLWLPDPQGSQREGLDAWLREGYRCTGSYYVFTSVGAA